MKDAHEDFPESEVTHENYERYRNEGGPPDDFFMKYGYHYGHDNIGRKIPATGERITVYCPL